MVNEDTMRKAGIPLDDDLFARAEGAKMMKPTTPPPATAKEGSLKEKRRKKGKATMQDKSRGC